MDIIKAAEDLKEDLKPNSGERSSAVRVYLDEDQESYFDLSIERFPYSELFEVQVSLSSPPSLPFRQQNPAEENETEGQKSLLQPVCAVERSLLFKESSESPWCLSYREFQLWSASAFRTCGSAGGNGGRLFAVKSRSQKQKPAESRKAGRLAMAKGLFDRFPSLLLLPFKCITPKMKLKTWENSSKAESPNPIGYYGVNGGPANNLDKAAV